MRCRSWDSEGAIVEEGKHKHLELIQGLIYRFS